LLREIVRINDQAVAHAVDTIREALWNLEEKRICLLGLAFKPGTDDVRFSPALALGRALMADGAHLVGYDPEAAANAKGEFPEMEVADSPYDAAAGAHCVVLCTDWSEFRDLDLAKLREAVAYPVLVDARNLFDPVAVAAAGFTCYPTGRRPVRPDQPAR